MQILGTPLWDTQPSGPLGLMPALVVLWEGQGWLWWIHCNVDVNDVDVDVNKSVITSVVPSPRAVLVPVFSLALLPPLTTRSLLYARSYFQCLPNASSLSSDIMSSFLSPTFISELTLVFPVISTELFLYLCQSRFLLLARNESCFRAK